jgi:hypothetical protein
MLIVQSEQGKFWYAEKQFGVKIRPRTTQIVISAKLSGTFSKLRLLRPMDDEMNELKVNLQVLTKPFHYFVYLSFLLL